MGGSLDEDMMRGAKVRPWRWRRSGRVGQSGKSLPQQHLQRLQRASMMLSLLLIFGCQRGTPDTRPDLSAAATAALLAYAEHSPPDPKALLQLVLDGEFEAFEAQARAHEQGWEQLPAREIAYQHLFEALQQSDVPGLEQRLDAWVAQRRPSSSYIALGARGSYRVGLGYALRGAGWARETSREQFEAMAAQHELARQDLMAALALKPDFTAAHTLLISMARSDKRRPGEARRWLDLALAARPEAYMPRQRFLGGLLPRWGGSYQAMDEFTQGLEGPAAKNPLLWTLKGEAAADRGEAAYRQRDFQAMLQHYNAALSHGRRADFLRGRARAYWELGQWQLALQDYERCLTQSPFDGECREHQKTLADYAARVGG